jgi:hypothetical protein
MAGAFKKKQNRRIFILFGDFGSVFQMPSEIRCDANFIAALGFLLILTALELNSPFERLQTTSSTHHTLLFPDLPGEQTSGRRN